MLFETWSNDDAQNLEVCNKINAQKKEDSKHESSEIVFENNVAHEGGWFGLVEPRFPATCKSWTLA